MRTRLRRGLLVLFLLAVVWAAGVIVTGGFAITVGSSRISSRHPDQALAIAALAAIAVAALSWKPDVRRTLVGDLRSLRFAPALLIAAISILVIMSYWTARAPLWLDEESIALNVRDRTVGNLAQPLWLGQSAPLGWLVLERVVMLGLGTGELALRFLPVLFGVATVIVSAGVGRRWLSPAGAAGFVLMCAFGQWLAHYRYEVKHYTADAFCGLLLPALALWAIDTDDAAIRGRRLVVWWTVAAATLWIANGAIFVAPACALFLVFVTWRQEGARGVLRASAAWLIWLCSFALFYYLSLQHTLKSGFLWTYWAEHLPHGGGILATWRWMAARLPTLAENPGGSELWWGFWVVVVGGLAFGSKPVLRILLAAVTVSIFAFASLGLFPFYERFVLWGVPGLYLAMILLIDKNLMAGWRAARARHWIALAVAGAIPAAAGWVCADIVLRGWRDTRNRTAEHKHSLDDRSAVEWLMELRQPGDALVTTRLAWPAVWWYGGISLASFDSTSRPAQSVPAMYELTYERTNCPSPGLQEVLRNHPRVLLYLGFRDVPPGFDELALANFSKSAALTAYREFSALSRAAVFDGREAGMGQAIISRPFPEAPPISGCAGLRPMQRW